MTKDFITGIVYTNRVKRDIISAGPDGPLGDTVIISGDLYAKPSLKGGPIGKFDVSQLITSVNEFEERRQVTIELSFDRKYARNSWISRLDPPFKKPKQASEVNLTGVEPYPLGGGIPTQSFTLSVASGTGSFIGAEGTATIAPVPGTDLYAYTFALA